MDDFGVREHKWLKSLYNIRAKWCTTLSKDIFSVGIQSSQRSESTNNVLNGIANKTTSITKFFIAFEDLVAGWCSIELELNFQCKQSLPSYAIKNSSIMNHTTNIYTHKIHGFYIPRIQILYSYMRQEK